MNLLRVMNLVAGFLLDRPGVDRDEIWGYFERAGLRKEWDELEATF